MRNKNITELIDLKGYNDKFDVFEKANGYFDIVQVISKDIVNANDTDRDIDILNYWKFNQLFYDDIKYIAMNFNINTTLQQEHLKYILDRTIDPVRKLWLEREIYELEMLEENIQRREFYVMIFSQISAEDLSKKRNRLLDIIGDYSNRYFGEIPKERKLLILKRFCNMNSKISEGEFYNEIKNAI